MWLATIHEEKLVPLGPPMFALVATGGLIVLSGLGQRGMMAVWGLRVDSKCFAGRSCSVEMATIARTKELSILRSVVGESRRQTSASENQGCGRGSRAEFSIIRFSRWEGAVLALSFTSVMMPSPLHLCAP